MARPIPGHLSLISNHDRDLGHFADTVWLELRKEAEDALIRSPQLAPLFIQSVLDQPSFEAAVFHRISARLKNDVVSLPLLTETFARAAAADPKIALALRADIAAVLERDPATQRFIEPFLYFKGFHAVQTHRLAHWLWSKDERDFALYLQSRSSDVFQTDIHPAARFGHGVFLDHATGLVVGETAVVEDDVSLLQNVTLGGTGKESGDRHPKVRQGAIIGAGAKILGNIEIGAHSRIAAGSVVLKAVAPHSTVAGIPARIIRATNDPEALRSKEEILKLLSYESFDYSI
ncbi:serine O-acetyltransferase [Paramagnetospirillum kuznetsovii]|uniref:Serine acetyltransferase n=1 Tax=Paramagnetospirillum kuznetsovii TaxID=2053833 RepID=A0A364NTV1_9PROT|nr:serine O-acetyltransferase [Paramagnetospirillum kuznetsovii]RAU20529.1 serine O-acetyltransferase [Paramagnetospirillum kuznetsovii]